MPSCSAVNCTYRHLPKAKTSKSIHRFPLSKPEIVELWLKNVNRADWTPSRSSVLCSDHFEESCFIRKNNAVFLKHDAVPTKFDYDSESSTKKGRKKRARMAIVDYSEQDHEKREKADKKTLNRKNQKAQKKRLKKWKKQFPGLKGRIVVKGTGEKRRHIFEKMLSKEDLKLKRSKQKKLKVQQQRIRRWMSKLNEMDEIITKYEKNMAACTN